jgi:2-oxoglutarate ferredoxin oxidoreductase subunit gamma
MTEITQIRLSGLGGQGIVLAGILLGEAGAIDGKYVSGSDIYGAQARGSECKSEIVLSDGPIDFPHLITPDILMAMSQGAYNLYCEDIKKESGLILYDRTLVSPRTELKVEQIDVPATEIAVKGLKNKQVANILLLGFLIEKAKIVSFKAMQKAIALRIGDRFRALNLKALQVGVQLGRREHG